MWVEKYRPSRLNDLVNQKAIVKRLISLIDNPISMPHLLFAGRPGTGKTTSALALARTVLGEAWRDYTLELNASDERGINTVRQRVKTFARYADDRTKIPFKIIILDEADEMTHDAQTALRRIMEETSRVTRFILIGNYTSRIIEPIQSRCAVFHFSSLDENDVITHLQKICNNEGIECKKPTLARIYEITSGDLRHAINILQSGVVSGKIDLKDVENIAGLSSKAKVSEIVNLALKGNFKDARNNLVLLTSVYGMSERDFLKYANEEVMMMKLDNVEEVVKAFAKCDYRLIVGAHPEIQLSALLAELARIGEESKTK